jgi:hypothetical protein
MMIGLVRVLLAVVLAGSPALGQTRPAHRRNVPPTTVEPSSMPLPPAKQARVKEYLTRAKIPEEKVDGPVTVGMIVPEDLELWALPEDSVTEVPTVTSYKFIHVGGTIAVVDPDTRRVVQVILK